MIDRTETNRLRRAPRWLAVGAAGAFALAGCSGGSSAESAPPPPAAAQAGSETTQSPMPQTSEVCGPVPVKVFPGLHFKASNVNDIQKQLDTLKKAHDPSAQVGVGDFVQASAILTDSITDPLYSQAFGYADDHIHDPTLSASSLLRKDFVAPTPVCLQDEQIQETANLYGTLAHGLGPTAGRQLSAAARAAYDRLQTGFAHFKEEYNEQLNQ